MISKEWRKWVEDFPAEVTDSEPEYYIFKSQDADIVDRLDAEDVKEFEESGEEGRACRVYYFGKHFYVVPV